MFKPSNACRTTKALALSLCLFVSQVAAVASYAFAGTLGAPQPIEPGHLAFQSTATSGVDFDEERGHRYLRFSYAGTHADIVEAARRLQAWPRLKQRMA